jgi:hypothetical protein
LLIVLVPFLICNGSLHCALCVCNGSLIKMSSATCAGGGLASGKAAVALPPRETGKKHKGGLWGRRRQLRSHEHKGAGAVLAGLGGKADRRGDDGDDEKMEAEGAGAEGGAEGKVEAAAVASAEALRSALGNVNGSSRRRSSEGPLGEAAGACGLVTGEATPAMLYWEHKGLSLLPRWLACAHPTVKLIVTLRDPVQVSWQASSLPCPR